MSGEHVGIEVARYSEQYRQQWDDFVEQSQQGTLFHTRAFLAYHPPARFDDASLLFFKKEKLIAVLPAAAVVREGKKILSSHPGASFGGLATALLTLREATSLVEAMLQFCRREAYAALELHPPPAIYSSSSDHLLEFVYHRAGFQYQRREWAQAVCLAPGCSTEINQYDDEFQRKIRRAQKLGCIVRETEDLPGFYELLQNNLALRHGAQPTHTLAELLDLRQRFPRRIRLLAACVEEKMVAGFLLFVCNARTVLAFYISQLYEYQRYRAVNLLTHEARSWCTREGFSYFDFGASTIASEPNWGLIEFRENAGAQGVFRDTMFIDLGRC